jgi:hypothetical protein
MKLFNGRGVERFVWALAAAALPLAAHATEHFEVEPNDTKADALTQGAFVLAPGDSITGLSMGATGSEIDCFLVQTAPMPPGIYRHRLVLTTGSVGHTLTIRGLNQVAAGASVWPGAIGTPGATDAVAQTAATVGTTRVAQWYGFGKEEQIFVRVTGLATTQAPYTLTLETEAVTPLDCGSWMQGVLTISSVPPGHGNDVDMWVYDENFNALPGYGSDGASTNGGHTLNTNLPAHLRRHFGPGVYYLAISNFDLINNQGSPSDDNRRTGTLLDYPDAVLNGSATAPVHVHFTIADAVSQTQFNSTKSEAFEVRWHRFEVGGPSHGACCLPNGSCVIMDADRCVNVEGGVFQGSSTDCTACAPLAAGMWAERTSAPYARVGSAGAIIGNTFYLLGGSTSSGIRGTDCWKLDLVNNLWSPIAPMPHSGSVAPQLGGISNIDAAAIGSDIYLVGGYPGGTGALPLNRVLRYDTVLDEWEEITSDPYPMPVYGSGLVAHNGKLYVISGATAVGAPTTACYVYDPAAPAGSRWTALAPIPVGRAFIAATVANGRIYAVSGEATDQDRVDIYDIAGDFWTQGPSMNVQRGGTALYVMNGQPYAASGGWTAYTPTGEVFDGFNWNFGPSVITPLRSMAFDGNETWLVRSTGYNGAYRANTEVMRLESGPTCGTADFDGDGDVGTDADIEAFFACLAGNCCPTCYSGGADFDGDGDTGTDADIEAFFRVLAGGPC